MAQLKILCAHKRRDFDKVYVSKLKRDDLVALWLEWQHRPEVAVVDDSTIVPESHSDNISDDVHCDPLVDNHSDSAMIVDSNNVGNKNDVKVTMI